MHRKITLGVAAAFFVFGAAASAQPAENTVSAPAEPQTPPPWFAHANAGVPLYTSVGSWTNPSGGAVKAASFTPADRLALVQLVGFGRWVHPHIRINLSLQFAELGPQPPERVPFDAVRLQPAVTNEEVRLDPGPA